MSKLMFRSESATYEDFLLTKCNLLHNLTAIDYTARFEYYHLSVGLHLIH